jgi:hypothetical protein
VVFKTIVWIEKKINKGVEHITKADHNACYALRDKGKSRATLRRLSSTVGLMELETNENLIVLILILLIVLSLPQQLHAEEADEKNKPVGFSVPTQCLLIQEVSDVVVDRVITIVGKWGDYIHGKSYQQEALVTFKGWQYTTYYDAIRRLCVARRSLPSGSWQRIVFSDYTYQGDDNHNVPVLGICPKDGSIHLAFDHHGDSLNYRVSEANAANDPTGILWEASLFGPVVDYLVHGERVTGVTYPRFVNAPDKTLYIFFRAGGATNGRMWMSRYDPFSGGWADLRQITDSKGNYTFDSKTSTTRNAYQNTPCVDHNGRIHMSWVRREGGALSGGQHDLCYMYSDDGGKTFRNHLGTIVTEGNAKANINSPNLTVWPIGMQRGLKNQQAMVIDSMGCPHIVMWYLSDSANDIQTSSKDHTRSKYHHFWQTADGKWHKQELPFSLSSDQWTIRPQLAFDKKDQLYLVYNHNDNIAIAAATRAGNFTDWRLIKERTGNFTGEAKVDIMRLRHENILSIYMHERPSKAHESTQLHVIDFKIKVKQGRKR